MNSAALVPSPSAPLWALSPAVACVSVSLPVDDVWSMPAPYAYMGDQTILADKNV